MNSPQIDYNTVLRYIKADSIQSKELSDLYDKCADMVIHDALPKKDAYVSKATKTNSFYELTDLDIIIHSNDVSKLFDRCDQICVMALTLGPIVDKKTTALFHVDSLSGAMYDACASVYVEYLMDEFEEEIAEKYKDRFRTMRYSPGYGDLGLEIQSEIIDKLSLTKNLGITINKSSFLMSPMKTITAFLGLSQYKQVKGSACYLCPRKNECTTKCAKV